MCIYHETVSMGKKGKDSKDYANQVTPKQFRLPEYHKMVAISSYQQRTVCIDKYVIY